MSELSPFSRVMRKSYFRTSKTVIDPKATYGPEPNSSQPIAITLTSFASGDGTIQLARSPSSSAGN
jgi:hypothetical protein